MPTKRGSYVKYPSTKEPSQCGGYTYYTYWTPSMLKDGTVVYYKQVDKKVKKKRGMKCDQPTTKKRIRLMNEIKKKVVNNQSVTLNDISLLHGIVMNNPCVLRDFIRDSSTTASTSS